MNNNSFDDDKQKIITLFRNCVKGIEIHLDEHNTKHCGKEGYWLEEKMGVKHNSKNEPDIFGYEMKKAGTASSKTTLGDFSASEYLFSGKNKRTSINVFNSWTDEMKISRSEFIQIFGNPNPNKNNRFSWSGICVPKYNCWNDNGQTIIINENNDIIVLYSFSKDTRDRKIEFPVFLHNDNVVIAYWKHVKMKLHVEKKFNNNGFFICKKNGNIYDKICFGKPFNFEHFIDCFKQNKIIFDSGMYDGNGRNYSHFRGNSFWDELIIEEY